MHCHIYGFNCHVAAFDIQSKEQYSNKSASVQPSTSTSVQPPTSTSVQPSTSTSV